MITTYENSKIIDENMMELSCLLKQERKKKNITCEGLGNIIGLTKNRVSSAENAYTPPSLSTLIMYLKGLDYDFYKVLKIGIENYNK